MLIHYNEYLSYYGKKTFFEAECSIVVAREFSATFRLGRDIVLRDVVAPARRVVTQRDA